MSWAIKDRHGKEKPFFIGIYYCCSFVESPWETEGYRTMLFNTRESARRFIKEHRDWFTGKPKAVFVKVRIEEV